MYYLVLYYTIEHAIASTLPIYSSNPLDPNQDPLSECNSMQITNSMSCGPLSRLSISSRSHSRDIEWRSLAKSKIPGSDYPTFGLVSHFMLVSIVYNEGLILKLEDCANHRVASE